MAPTLPSIDEEPNRANMGNRGHASLRGNKRIRADEIVLRKKLTALVVDDAWTSRELMQGNLRSYGVETQSARNGNDAVELIASGAKFNLIVIEMLLPILNGIEATRQIRAMGARCKIVGVSACNNERERQAFRDAGIDEFIEKPLFLNNLVRILREIDGQ